MRESGAKDAKKFLKRRKRREQPQRAQSVVEDVYFPVYVLAKDCGEFTEYRSLEDMRAYMETIDVEGNEYDAWDAKGFVVRLISTNSKREWLRLEKTDMRISDARRDEIRLQAVPYVNGRRLRAKG